MTLIKHAEHLPGVFTLVLCEKAKASENGQLILFSNFLCIYFLCSLPTYMSVHHMHTECQKRALDALELELWTVLSCQAGDGN